MKPASFLLLAFACSCGKSPLHGATSAVTATPDALHFGATFVGHPGELQVVLENGGAAPASVTVEVGAPFSADANSFQLAGGASQRVAVTFAPGLPGPASGTLTIHASDSPDLSIALDGTGVAVPTCTPSGPCKTSTFSLDAGGCVEAELPEDSPCGDASSCLTEARCIGGQCLGVAASCDDSDACTADACDPALGGCEHFDISAQCPPPSDACHVATCDPGAGCGFDNAPDGTLCGPTDCNTAHVCVDGSCLQLPAPDGFECAPATPCQVHGTCQDHVCVQPAAEALQPAWTYVPDSGTIRSQQLLADAQGNVYWYEDHDDFWPDGGVGAQLVSYTSNGFPRWRATVPSTSGGAPPPSIINGDEVIVAPSAVMALSVADGRLLWTHDVAADVVAVQSRLDAGGVPGDYVSLTAIDAHRVVAHSTFYRQVSPGSYDESWVAVALDQDGGATLWTTSEPHLSMERASADEAGNLYVGLESGVNSVTRFQLESFAPNGALRWSVPQLAFNGPVYGCRLSVIVVDGGSQIPNTSTCEDGGLLAALNEPPGPLVYGYQAFDGATTLGAIDVYDAGAGTFGDCNDLPLETTPHNPAIFMARWDLNTGAVSTVPLSPAAPSEPVLLGDGSFMVIDARIDCANVLLWPDGGLAETLYPALSRLRRVARSGRDVFACQLPGLYTTDSIYAAPLPLTRSRWAALVRENFRLGVQVFDIGDNPVGHGWIMSGGNAGQGDRPQ